MTRFVARAQLRRALPDESPLTCSHFGEPLLAQSRRASGRGDTGLFTFHLGSHIILSANMRILFCPFSSERE